MKFLFSTVLALSFLYFTPVSASDLLNSGHVDQAFQAEEDDLLNEQHAENAFARSDEDLLRPHVNSPLSDFCKVGKGHDIFIKKPNAPAAPNRPAVISPNNDFSDQLPEEYSFNLNYDVAEQAGINLPNGFEMIGKVGEIIFKDGKVFFNDQELDTNQQTVFNKLCVDIEE
tara:strand:- start:79 stop:591 length:513 start_codon:yes stop_codon:yes gene_type:complete